MMKNSFQKLYFENNMHFSYVSMSWNKNVCVVVCFLLPEASFGIQVLSLPVSVCVSLCVSLACPLDLDLQVQI